MAARSKVWVCVRSLAGTVGSNPAGGKNVSCQCCVSRRGLCDEPITRLEKCGVYEHDREGPVAPWGGADILPVFSYGCETLSGTLREKTQDQGAEEDIWY